MIISVGLVGSTMYITPTTSLFGINQIVLKSNDSYFDKVRLLSTPLTETVMDGLKKTDEYSWTPETLVLAEFEQNLLCGNIGIDVDNIEKGIIYRAPADDPDNLTLLYDNISPDAIEYTDFTAIDGEEYIYYLTLVDSTGATTALFNSNNITSEYDSFFLIDPVENISFRFNLNSSSSQITKNEIFNVYTSAYDQYPIFSRGLTFFDQGTINCLLGYIDEDCNYVDTVEYLESLENIIKNDNIKIIKNRSGNVWNVQTANLRYLADTKLTNQFRTISFDFYEASAVNGGG